MAGIHDDQFRSFVETVEPSLRRAVGGHLPRDEVPDALAEAFAHAWEHWGRVQGLANRAGHLFRVAQSRSRTRRVGRSSTPVSDELPDVEPGLVRAMQALSSQQRSAVWLVHGCGWSYAEAASAMQITPSAVGSHLGRGMTRLRADLGVVSDE